MLVMIESCKRIRMEALQPAAEPVRVGAVGSYQERDCNLPAPESEPDCEDPGEPKPFVYQTTPHELLAGGRADHEKMKGRVSAHGKQSFSSEHIRRLD